MGWKAAGTPQERPWPWARQRCSPPRSAAGPDRPGHDRRRAGRRPRRARPPPRRRPAVMALVERLVMPHVDMARLTGLAMGRYWRTASEDQQRRLEDEFKTSSFAATPARWPGIGWAIGRDASARAAAGDERRRCVDGDPRPRRAVPRSTTGCGAARPAGRSTTWPCLASGSAENYRNSFAQEIGRSGIEG